MPDLVSLASIHPAWCGSVTRPHVAQVQEGIRSKIQPLSEASFLVLGLNRLYSGVDELSESLFVEVAEESQEASVSMADLAMQALTTTALRFPHSSDKHPWRITPSDVERNAFNTRDTKSIRCVHRITQRIEAFPQYEVLELQLEVLHVQSADSQPPLWNALFDYCPRETEWRGYLCNWFTFPCEPTRSQTTWQKPVAHLTNLIRRLK